MGDIIKENLNPDGIDRRGFLKCMAWAGTGAFCLMQGGVLKSYAFGHAHPADLAGADFAFAQISDSHIGFDKAANPDVTATLQQAIAKLNALPTAPEFVLHTGDLTQLSKASEFDTLDQALKSVRTDKIFFVPGEHDVLNDNGEQYRARYGKGTQGDGWQSFDHRGVHFIGLVNVMNLKAGGLGILGPEQLKWLEDDLRSRSASTPIVVFAHVPLWTVYPEWGWGTEDSAQALGYLKRFGSVTVLNGHIHQIMQKVEGNVTFHTAMSTAFPQPIAGTAPSAGPLKVPSDRLRQVLGLTDVNYVAGGKHLAVVDATLAGTPTQEADNVLRAAAAALPKTAPQQPNQSASSTGDTLQAAIDNFAFTPQEVTAKVGSTVRWTNKDDIPHTVTSDTKVFESSVLDTNQTFQFTFAKAGRYPYFCKLHPHMTGAVIVQ